MSRGIAAATNQRPKTFVTGASSTSAKATAPKPASGQPATQASSGSPTKRSQELQPKKPATSPQAGLAAGGYVQSRSQALDQPTTGITGGVSKQALGQKAPRGPGKGLTSGKRSTSQGSAPARPKTSAPGSKPARKSAAPARPKTPAPGAKPASTPAAPAPASGSTGSTGTAVPAANKKTAASGSGPSSGGASAAGGPKGTGIDANKVPDWTPASTSKGPQQPALLSPMGGQKTMTASHLGGNNFKVGGMDYQKGQSLGAGAMGEVHLMKPQGHAGDPLVMKSAKPLANEYFDNEVAMHKLAGNHSNVVRYHGVVEAGGNKGLLMEHLGGGDLRKNMDAMQQMRQQGKLSEQQYWGGMQHLLKGTTQGLDHLYKQGIVHGDLKPDNIMLDPRTMQPKIADFGTAFMKKTPDLAPRGAAGYEDPQTYLNGRENRSRANDTWALGQIAYEADQGKLFGEGHRNIHLTNHISDPKNTVFPQPAGQGSQYMKDYQDFTNKMMTPYSKDRMNPSVALQHPFLQNSILPQEQVNDVLRQVIAFRGGSP